MYWCHITHTQLTIIIFSQLLSYTLPLNNTDFFALLTFFSLSLFSLFRMLLTEKVRKKCINILYNKTYGALKILKLRKHKRSFALISYSFTFIILENNHKYHEQ
jgi:hypothetical protein